MSALDELRRQLKETKSVVSEASKKASDQVEVEDRSKIAQGVVWLYIALTSTCFIFILVVFWAYTPCSGAETTGCLAWKEPANYLLQVLTTAVLPIVTLVLGYYFGVSSASGGQPPKA